MGTGLLVGIYRHGAAFDVTSGSALSLPAIKPVKTYDVELEDGGIWLRLD